MYVCIYAYDSLVQSSVLLQCSGAVQLYVRRLCMDFWHMRSFDRSADVMMWISSCGADSGKKTERDGEDTCACQVIADVRAKAVEVPPCRREGDLESHEPRTSLTKPWHESDQDDCIALSRTLRRISFRRHESFTFPARFSSWQLEFGKR